MRRIRTDVGHEAWQATSYSEVRRLLGDDRLGRSHPDPENAARFGDSALFGGPHGDFETEREDHAKMRRLLQPHFSPKRMRALEPRVAELTTQVLDQVAAQAPSVDLHMELAVPLPVLVICELLGAPYADRDQIRDWTLAAVDTSDRSRSEQGLVALAEYGQKLVAQKRKQPADDVISRLCAEEGLPDDEIAGLSVLLLFAGHETAVVQIGLGVLRLLTHPEEWRIMRDNPELIKPMVEELLRLSGHSGDRGLPRYARTDVQIDEHIIQAGDLVLLDLGSANHDPAVFSSPDKCDPARSGNHLLFGHGMTFCLGAPLARIELRTMFSQLIPRFPDMRLAVPESELEFRPDVLTECLTSLPVTW